MAIAITRLGREKRLSTLARNIFVIEGPDKAALQRRAERALLAANPKLSTQEGFVAGVTIVVPSVPGLAVTDRVSATKANLEGLLTEAVLRLETDASRIDEGFRRQDLRTAKALEQLGDKKFTAAARKAVPESDALIKQARAKLKKDADTANARRLAFQSAIDSAKAEIDRLSKLDRGFTRK